uniref:DUF4604 domain-containing protein n=1 Tax=Heterorhabditis bacteriophora TaxID=37862 RepID=A0A1I7XH40_HETBA
MSRLALIDCAATSRHVNLPVISIRRYAPDNLSCFESEGPRGHPDITTHLGARPKKLHDYASLSAGPGIMSSDRKLTYKEKSGISFIAQEDPPFIKQMKQKMGYKEPPKLEDKFTDEDGPIEADDPQNELLRLKEEDRPQVVVLNPETDLSRDEMNKELKAKQKEEDGNIVFRKPLKRNREVSSDQSERKKTKEDREDNRKKESRLLSFDEEDEENE